MFDTLVFPEPIDCVQCGDPVPSTQTKSLGSTLDTYRVGDVVSADGITTGVLTEELYCKPCRKFDQKIYVTLWHGLITGFYTDEAEAERPYVVTRPPRAPCSSAACPILRDLFRKLAAAS